MIMNTIICHESGQSCNMEDIQKHILSCNSCKKLAKQITIHTTIKAMNLLISVYNICYGKNHFLSCRN